jgi:hypothetical protein
MMGRIGIIVTIENTESEATIGLTRDRDERIWDYHQTHRDEECGGKG